MNLHHLSTKRNREKGPLRVGLIGAGKFGSMYLAQARSTEGVHIAAIADLAPARAIEALRRTGWHDGQGTAASLADALAQQTTFITDDAPAMIAAGKTIKWGDVATNGQDETVKFRLEMEVAFKKEWGM